MNKKIIKIALPVLITSLALGSYVLTKKNVLAQGKNIRINTQNALIENTIDLVQVRNLEGIQGVSNLFHYDGDSKIIFGMNPEFDSSKTSEVKEDTDLTEYYRMVYGDIYSTDVKSVNPSVVKADNIPLKSLDADFGIGYSPDGKLVDYSNDEGSFILNTETGSQKKYNSGNSYGDWSEDSNYLIKYGTLSKEDADENGKRFFLFDRSGKIVKKISLPEHITWVDISSGFYSVDGSSIYFSGRSFEDDDLKTGLYRLDSTTESVDSLLTYSHSRRDEIDNPGTDLKEHPGEKIEVYYQSRIFDFHFLKNGNIIFQAMIENNDGLYMYDKVTDDVILLLDVHGAFGFKVSPDEKKIVYSIDSISEDKTHDSNLYIAHIKSDSLDDITLVRKNTIGNDYKWSNDSKQVICYNPLEKKILSVKIK